MKVPEYAPQNVTYLIPTGLASIIIGHNNLRFIDNKSLVFSCRMAAPRLVHNAVFLATTNTIPKEHLVQKILDSSLTNFLSKAAESISEHSNRPRKTLFKKRNPLAGAEILFTQERNIRRLEHPSIHQEL